jgi:hypothetical protein
VLEVLLAAPQSVAVPGALTAATASRNEHSPSCEVNSSAVVVTVNVDPCAALASAADANNTSAAGTNFVKPPRQTRRVTHEPRDPLKIMLLIPIPNLVGM